MNPENSNTPSNIMTFFLNNPNFNVIDQNTLCLHPYFPIPHEFELLRAEAMNSSQLPNNHIVQGLNNLKYEVPTKFEGKCEYIPKPTKIESEPSDQGLCDSEFSTTPSQTSQSLTQGVLKSEIEKMVRFLFSNMGKGNEALINSTKSCYLHNPTLVEVYDKISMRFYSAKKYKEDLIRYILRKIFRHLRTSIMRREKVTSKKASLLMCKRYFQSGEMPSDVEDEEKFLESLLPYNKNSKNKTMNISFILEIFESQSFCKEYQDFLPSLNKLIVDENKKKEAKLVKFIMECIGKKCLEKVSAAHRLPWLDVWMEDAKNLAIAIMPNKRLIYNFKQPKSW